MYAHLEYLKNNNNKKKDCRQLGKSDHCNMFWNSINVYFFQEKV